MIRISLSTKDCCEDFIKNKYNKIDKIKETKTYSRDFLMIGQTLSYNLSDINEDMEGFKIIDANKECLQIQLINTSNTISSIYLNNNEITDTNNFKLYPEDTLFLYKQNNSDNITYISITLHKLIEADLVINI